MKLAIEWVGYIIYNKLYENEFHIKIEILFVEWETETYYPKTY